GVADRMEDERLPCLTTGTPAAATTIAAAVLMLNVPVPSPPVPHVSRTGRVGGFNRVMQPRRTSTAVAISDADSPFALKPIRNAVASASSNVPVVRSPTAARIKSSGRSRPSSSNGKPAMCQADDVIAMPASLYRPLEVPGNCLLMRNLTFFLYGCQIYSFTSMV